MAQAFCNIGRDDRAARIVFGVLVLLGVFLNWSIWYFVILSAIMIIEGMIGWCGVAAALQKIFDKSLR